MSGPHHQSKTMPTTRFTATIGIDPGQTTFQVAFDQVDLVYFHTDPPGDGDDPRRG